MGPQPTTLAGLVSSSFLGVGPQPISAVGFCCFGPSDLADGATWTGITGEAWQHASLDGVAAGVMSSWMPALLKSRFFLVKLSCVRSMIFFCRLSPARKA